MNHLRLVVSSLLLAGAVSACDKPNDVPRLQEAATASAASFKHRFAELQERVNEIHGDTLTDGNAQRVYQQAAATVGRYSNDLNNIKVRVDAGVKSGEAVELQKLVDEMQERFEGGAIEANAELDAVESWVAFNAPQPHGHHAEGHPAPPAPAAATVPPAGDSPADPAGTVQTGSPQPTGSGAQIR